MAVCQPPTLHSHQTGLGAARRGALGVLLPREPRTAGRAALEQRGTSLGMTQPCQAATVWITFSFGTSPRERGNTSWVRGDYLSQPKPVSALQIESVPRLPFSHWAVMEREQLFQALHCLRKGGSMQIYFRDVKGEATHLLNEPWTSAANNLIINND